MTGPHGFSKPELEDGLFLPMACAPSVIAVEPPGSLQSVKVCCQPMDSIGVETNIVMPNQIEAAFHLYGLPIPPSYHDQCDKQENSRCLTAWCSCQPL